MLNVFKQPGANVIETVDTIKAALPRLERRSPPAIKVTVISDRTETIRASVADVQFTLLLTIGLVVVVIFLFLRSVWATVIPGVTVPLALLGTFGADVPARLQPRQSVADGADDRGRLRRGRCHRRWWRTSSRHIEDGQDAAARRRCKGAGEIGFTILSITLSLVAVFIPLLLMGGIVGRMFREFAVTVTIAIVVSVVVSLTLTPMMCVAPAARRTPGRARPLLSVRCERGFDALLPGYDRGLIVALRHRFVTLMMMLATVAADRLAVHRHPEGLLPAAGHRPDIRTSEAAQDISFAGMMRRAAGARRDRAGGSRRRDGRGDRRRRRQLDREQRPRLHRAEAADQRRPSADQIIARLRPQARPGHGRAALFMQAAQDVNVGGRLTRTQYQYTLQDADLDELNQWAPKILGRDATAAGAARRHDRSADRRADAAR